MRIIFLVLLSATSINYSAQPAHRRTDSEVEAAHFKQKPYSVRLAGMIEYLSIQDTDMGHIRRRNDDMLEQMVVWEHKRNIYNTDDYKPRICGEIIPPGLSLQRKLFIRMTPPSSGDSKTGN